MNEKKLNVLKKKYGTWRNVAKVLNVSPRTIRYWRSETYKPSTTHQREITKKSRYNYKKYKNIRKWNIKSENFMNKTNVIRSDFKDELEKTKSRDNPDMIFVHGTALAWRHDPSKSISVGAHTKLLYDENVYQNIRDHLYRVAVAKLQNSPIHIKIQYITVEEVSRI